MESKIYLICKKQKSGGCDYSIACGMSYVFFRIEKFEGTSDEAISYFMKEIAYPDGIDERFALEGDLDLEEVLIVEVGKIFDIDLDQYRKEHERFMQEIEECGTGRVPLAQTKEESHHISNPSYVKDRRMQC